MPVYVIALFAPLSHRNRSRTNKITWKINFIIVSGFYSILFWLQIFQKKSFELNQKNIKGGRNKPRCLSQAVWICWSSGYSNDLPSDFLLWSPQGGSCWVCLSLPSLQQRVACLGVISVPSKWFILWLVYDKLMGRWDNFNPSKKGGVIQSICQGRVCRSKWERDHSRREEISDWIKSRGDWNLS